ncbi:MAG: hypothetical protein V1742_09570 [Pseudomonadota bacterium]
MGLISSSWPALSPKQVLVLWNLIFTGQEPMISRLRPSLTPRERRAMEEAGLILIEKRGRAGYILLTDKAWALAAANLEAEIALSKYAAPVLRAVLTSLKRQMNQSKFSLAEFAAEEFDFAAEISGEAAGFQDGVEVLPDEQIKMAYLKAAGGRSNVRVRLSELRSLLPHLPKPRLDAELIAMQRARRFNLVLWSLDDPRDIGPEDEKAAVDVAGVKRHIVYMEVQA